MQIIRLQNASAIDIAQMLQRVVPETSAPAERARAPRAKAAIAVDPRTNSLIVRADNPPLMHAHQDARRSGLDTPGAGNGNIYTVFLRNAEATRIAETLRGLLSGSESSRTTHDHHARRRATRRRRPRPRDQRGTSAASGARRAPRRAR